MHQIRNIFDQYSQPENRLTHALVQVLARDENLAREFLARFVPGLKVPPKHELCFSCQRFPEQEAELPEAKLAEEEEAGGGIPDFWVYRKGDDDEPGWAVFCECKVTARLGPDQLKNHAKTAHGRGFRRLFLLTITPTKAKQEMFRFLPPYVQASPAAWSEVYEFFADHKDSHFVEDFLDYMHVVEAQMISSKEAFEPLTKFTGIPFAASHAYSDMEAKTTLRALMRELRPRLEASKALPPISHEAAKKPITGPWDVVGFRFAASQEIFTQHPHITVSLDREGCGVQITLPNNAKSAYWKRVRGRGKQQLLDTLREVADDLGARKPLERGLMEPNLILYLEQVHFYARRYPTRDGNMIFDVSTILGGQPEGHIRPVDAWLSALSSILAATTQANFELGLKVQYPYVNGSACRNADFVDVLVKSAEALGPFLVLLTED